MRSIRALQRHIMCGMGREGAAGAEGMRMRCLGPGRRKFNWVVVAVAIALVGHAILMAGGAHAVDAAHAVPASTVTASHGSAAHHAATAPDAMPALHATHGRAQSSTEPTADAGTTAEPHPMGLDPSGDRTDGCGGLLALAWPQALSAPSSGSTLVVPTTVDLSVLPVAEGRVVASRLDPTDPPGSRRALLQVYRL